MTAYLLAGPAEEPVSLAEAKAFVRVDDAAEDGLIATLIAAARLHIEGTTARALVAQSWRLVLDCWPVTRRVKLPVAPLISLTAITAYDATGDDHEIELAQFGTEAAAPLLLLPDTIEGMPNLRERQGIEIDYVAGYGADAADVPADLRQALLGLVAYWFENRDLGAASGMAGPAPNGFERLIAPYRRARL
jgi:uncharacterized phiE125 gp8 family phage protein